MLSLSLARAPNPMISAHLSLIDNKFHALIFCYPVLLQKPGAPSFALFVCAKPEQRRMEKLQEAKLAERVQRFEAVGVIAKFLRRRKRYFDYAEGREVGRGLLGLGVY